MQKKRAVFKRMVTKSTRDSQKRFKDTLVAEEPFTVVWQSQDGVSERLASTMRTPGDDLSLAAGMLFSEGAILGRADLKILSFCSGGGVNELNRLKAELVLGASVIQTRLAHRPSQSLPQSACGMCSVDDLGSPARLVEWAAGRSQGPGTPPAESSLNLALNTLENDCPLFSRTGASHACVVVCLEKVLAIGEDVGRHNACDKAIGQLLLAESRDSEIFRLPPDCGLLFSSRLSFELASKAVAVGASWVASVGAPTALAVELAEACRLPLLGFVSRERRNIYS